MPLQFYLQKRSAAIQESDINITKRLATLSKRVKAKYYDKQNPLVGALPIYIYVHTLKGVSLYFSAKKYICDIKMKIN